LFIFVVFLALFVIARQQAHFTGGRDLRGVQEIIVGDFTTEVDYSDMDGKIKKYSLKSGAYKPHDSNEQIRAVAQRGAVGEIARLVQLLAKHINKRPNEAFTIATKLIKRPDRDVYEELCKYFDRSEDARAFYQAATMYQPLKAHTGGKFASYLDIGCGNGTITAELSKLMCAEDVHCVEVKKYDDHDGIKYSMIPYNGEKIDHPDGKFDLVTAVMSLHHIVKIEAIIAEIKRVIKPGGILYIKEHDCWNAIDAMLIDIEHNIFTYCNEPDNPDKNPYMAHYKNYWAWIKLITEIGGFEYVAANYYHASPANTITPTRAFWAIFKCK